MLHTIFGFGFKLTELNSRVFCQLYILQYRLPKQVVAGFYNDLFSLFYLHYITSHVLKITFLLLKALFLIDSTYETFNKIKRMFFMFVVNYRNVPHYQ